LRKSTLSGSVPTATIPNKTERFAEGGAFPSWPAVQACVIVLAALAVFYRSLHGEWLWDDETLITQNRDLQNLVGLARIWFAAPVTDYWPVTWTLLWVEWHLWGNHPLPYHLVSVALHVWSAFLIWQLLERLGLKWGWLGGLLFVIHPLAVESVAWISEIKNTLSLPCYLLALHAWLDFDQHRREPDYRRSVLYYLVAMLAKSSVVMLPAVLLLYTWWRRNRITRDEVKRMIPYVAIALVLGLLTIYFQNSHTPEEDFVRQRGILAKLSGAGVAVFFYISKFLLPYQLLPIYPLWPIEPPSLLQLSTLPFLILMLAGLWTQRRGWGRHALLGAGFFLLNLAPVSGLLVMSYMNISWVADHLVYLPMIGLIGLTVAGFEALHRRMNAFFQPILIGVVALLGLALAWQSHAYSARFASQIGLWTYTVAHNPESFLAHGNLGRSYFQAGRNEEALDQAELALKLRPDLAEEYNDAADALSRMPGRLPEAISEYEAALKVEPNYPLARVNLGIALERDNRADDAIAQFKQALQEDPQDFRAHYNLADALASDSAQAPAAVAEYQAALQLNPDSARVHNNLGGLYLTLPDHLPDAVAEFQAALRLEPDFAQAHYNLGTALSKMPGRLPDAITEYQADLRLEPDDLAAHYHLALALSQMPGRAAEAIAHLQIVLQAKPDFQPAQDLLDRLQTPP
jgi:tetratricopeptide (TPR) repeat protein